MGKNKKAKRMQKEEEQAGKVIKIIFISLIVLGLFMLIGFSLLS